uniref:Uncharacterized protein n=1 Tax=Salix viminalis TaxID=40686 RepID=A0A6N2KMX5_SALVM
MVSSASATARTTIFHYDVQLEGRTNNTNRRFLLCAGLLADLICCSCQVGVGAYLNILPGSEWTAIMLTYCFPLAIIGMALKLKYAELKPVPCLTSSDAEMLREKCATPILKTGIFSIGHNDLPEKSDSMMNISSDWSLILG